MFSYIFKNDKLLLTKHYDDKRWWEALGGHVEPWEKPIESARREIMEEGWLHVNEIALFSHTKITAKTPKSKREWWFYPFPHSYGLYYIGTTNEEPRNPSCELIEKAAFFTEKEALEITKSHNHKKIIHAFKYYRSNFQ